MANHRADKAWEHYKRTGVIIPAYQSEIADRIAARGDASTTEEQLAGVDRQRVKI